MSEYAARSRAGSRGVTALEAAIGFAVMGAALATAVPACLRAIRLTRTAEAAENLELVLTSATRLHAEPPPIVLTSTPVTPAAIPRGDTAVDPAGTWDHPTWKALGFALTEPHWYAYRIDVERDPRTPLRASAFGDLDGDGVLSTFERSITREGNSWVAQPALIVTSELE